MPLREKSLQKSQVSLVFLMGFVLLIAVSIALSLNTNEPQLQQTADFSENEFFIQKCLEQQATTAVLSNAFRGGFYDIKEPYLQITLLRFPYYLFEGENFAPSKTIMTRELEKAMDSEAIYCIEEFRSTFDSQVASEFEKPSSTVSITDQEVIFSTTFPIALKKQNSQKEIHSFSTTVPIQLNPVLEFIAEFTEQDIYEPDGICITCLSNLAEKYNLQISTQMFEKTVLFEIRQEGELPITWIFANEYS